MRAWRHLFVLCIGLSISLGATQIIDEAQLFTAEDAWGSSSDVRAQNINDVFERESVAFNGIILAKALTPFNQTYSAYTDTNFFLDVRLKKGYKAFMNIGLANAAQSSQLSSSILVPVLKEYFLDLNWNHAVYARVGKQVLQWGRTYFWNPVDLVNVEKKSFINPLLYRTGTFGLKVHVPMGVSMNVYSFLDLSSSTNVSAVAWVPRVEWLVGGSEFGLSAWTKTGQPVVWAADGSTRWGGWGVVAEWSASYGALANRIIDSGGTPTLNRITDTWIHKVSAGLSRQFDWEYANRISVTLEAFYNQTGYTNIVSDSASYALLLANSLYVPNELGRLYGALFVSINKFPATDFTWTMNGIANVSDQTGILVTGLSYSPVEHVTLGSMLYLYVGAANGEYTIAGQRSAMDVSVTMTF